VYSNTLKNYQEVEKATLSGRETEARVLTKAAQKLLDCQRRWKDGHFEELDAALKFNQKVWSIFQGELSKPENPLPTQVKADLLRLSGFIDRRIFETMSFPSSDKLDIIIKINQNIAAGLRGSA
jgi:flagellar biosynthesis activator protein FlaF